MEIRVPTISTVPTAGIGGPAFPARHTGGFTRFEAIRRSPYTPVPKFHQGKQAKLICPQGKSALSKQALILISACFSPAEIPFDRHLHTSDFSGRSPFEPVSPCGLFVS